MLRLKPTQSNVNQEVTTMNFAETYARMGNDELLQLSSEWATLTSPAQAALAAEMQKRNLGNELQATRQASAEPQPPSVPPSTTERVMCVLFVGSLVAGIVLPLILPRDPDLVDLYGIFFALCRLWFIWLIVWQVLRFKRVKNAKAALRSRVEELARATERTT
jgi:hypothetical protein